MSSWAWAPFKDCQVLFLAPIRLFAQGTSGINIIHMLMTQGGQERIQQNHKWRTDTGMNYTILIN